VSTEPKWDPGNYLEMIRREVPGFDRLQEATVDAVPFPPGLVLDLGIGTGETSRRLLEAYPDARITGLDSSPDMVFRAREMGIEVRLARMEDPLPDGPWDLVVSVLSVNDLDDEQKQALFRRVKEHSRSLVIGDSFEPAELAAVVEWSEGEVTWEADGLAVVHAVY
jgi:tRNA (cmo5U34)-methyltransferase